MNETTFLQGKSLYDSGKYQQSVSAFRQVLQKTPEYLDARRLLASALYRSGSFDAAVKEYEILLRSNTVDAWTHHGLGVSLAGQKKWEQAILCFQSALQLDPSFQVSYTALGMVLVKLGDKTKRQSFWEEAKYAFEMAISLQSDQQSAKTLAGLANVEWHLGNKSRAIDLAKAATEVNPKYSWGWTRLLHFQIKSGKFSAAWKSWQGILQTKGHFENERAR